MTLGKVSQVVEDARRASPRRRRAARSGLVAFVLLLAVAGCRTEPIVNYVDEPLGSGSGLTLDQVGDAIDQAGMSLGWKIRTVRPGRAVAVFTRKTHLAQVVIDYDTERFSITYVRSSNLEEDEGRVHKAYNIWVRELAERIKFAVETQG